MKTYEIIPELGKEILFYYEDSFHIGYIVSYNGSEKPRKWTWFSEINNLGIIEEYIENWFELPNKEIMDKDSVKYFMTQMSQEEFEERNKDKIKCVPYEFNRIHPKQSEQGDLIKMIVPPEPDEMTKMRLEQDVEFVKSCCGVNEDLLGM